MVLHQIQAVWCGTCPGAGMRVMPETVNFRIFLQVKGRGVGTIMNRPAILKKVVTGVLMTIPHDVPRIAMGRNLTSFPGGDIVPALLPS